VARDRRQSICSLAFIALQFAIGDTLYQKFHWGWQAMPLSLWSVPLTFVASMLLFDTWFYWMHRLIHQKPLFAIVHRWHHLTRTPVAWSNNSDRLIDNLFIQSYWTLAHFLLPVSPYVLVAHKLYDQITGTIGHAGVEYGGPLCRPGSPMISVTHHDQHHRYFSCNYATHFTLWDRAMGTLHPDHDRELADNLRRRALANKELAGKDKQGLKA
jgi:sterol desaturase/sphingolipid hydroxylase (fatty acid hydroxylase superfamily)